MSESMGAEIFIGGLVPEKLIAKLCSEITASGASLEWGDAPFEPTSAGQLLGRLVERDGQQVPSLCDHEANWGQFADLEAFLVRHGIPFDRYSEGKYEFDPEWVSFRRGGKPYVLPINSQREPQVYLASLRDVRQKIDLAVAAAEQRQHEGVVAHLRELKESLDKLMPPLPSPLDAFAIGRAM